jgi:hypothetical protein
MQAPSRTLSLEPIYQSPPLLLALAWNLLPKFKPSQQCKHPSLLPSSSSPLAPWQWSRPTPRAPPPVSPAQLFLSSSFIWHCTSCIKKLKLFIWSLRPLLLPQFLPTGMEPDKLLSFHPPWRLLPPVPRSSNSLHSVAIFTIVITSIMPHWLTSHKGALQPSLHLPPSTVILSLSTIALNLQFFKLPILWPLFAHFLRSLLHFSSRASLLGLPWPPSLSCLSSHQYRPHNQFQDLHWPPFFSQCHQGLQGGPILPQWWLLLRLLVSLCLGFPLDRPNPKGLDALPVAMGSFCPLGCFSLSSLHRIHPLPASFGSGFLSSSAAELWWSFNFPGPILEEIPSVIFGSNPQPVPPPHAGYPHAHDSSASTFASAASPLHCFLHGDLSSSSAFDLTMSFWPPTSTAFVPPPAMTPSPVATVVAAALLLPLQDLPLLLPLTQQRLFVLRKP